MKNISKLLNLLARERIIIRTIFFRSIYLEYQLAGISMSRRQEYLKQTVIPNPCSVSSQMNPGISKNTNSYYFLLGMLNYFYIFYNEKNRKNPGKLKP